MLNIGFLACKTTLPSGGERRGDAYEHDLMIAALEPAFLAHRLNLEVIDWEAPLDQFNGLDLILLGSSWNYQDHAAAFLAKLDALASRGIIICNPLEVVRWNTTKTYLRELEKLGAQIIPTRWLDYPTAADANAAMDAFGCDRLVVKRQIGAGALGQQLLVRGSLTDDWEFGHSAMLQPFLPAIAKDGELSFIFIDGEYSHALRKRPAEGDYRIQSLYGGTEEPITASAQEVAAAHAVIASLPFDPPLYARIDMLRSGDETLMVMEAEMIEPYLYPEQGPQLGERLARAIVKRGLQK